MWIAPATTHHLFRDKTYLQTRDSCSWWLPHFFSSYAIHADAFKPVYIPYKIFRHILNTATIRLLQKFHHHFHGDCRILANGMRIFHLEYRYCFATILDRGSWSSYPQHSHRMHLHYLLLDIHQPHTMPTVWRNIIWMFCFSTECSFHPTTVISRWRLWKWFWHHWFTNPFMENSLHTPHFQSRTCLFQPSEHYTPQYSHHNTLQYTVNSYQTSALLLILQLRYWQYPRQHSSMFRQLRWRGRRFSDGTSGWWALDL